MVIPITTFYVYYDKFLIFFNNVIRKQIKFKMPYFILDKVK